MVETEVVAKGRSPIILACSSILLIVIIVAGLTVYFLVDKKFSKTILIVFLIIVIIIGILMMTFIEYQRRKAQKRKDIGANRWIEETYEAQHNRPQPSAPPLTERSSWALLPRKWSTATALPAYSP